MSQLSANDHLPASVSDNLADIHRLVQQKTPDIKKTLAHLQKTLGKAESYAQLRLLRWPEGIVCPRCRSQNIRRRPAPRTDADYEFKRFYECLDCLLYLGNGDFDDLTGICASVISHIQDWILKWFILVLLPPSEAARLLNVPEEYLFDITAIAQELALHPDSKNKYQMEMMTFGLKKKEEKTKQLKNSELEEEIKQTRDIFFHPKPKSRY